MVTEPAGFYLFKQTTEGVEYRAGWIVLPDQQQRASLVVGGTPRLAHSTLNPATLSATLPQLGTVRPAALTSKNTAKGFGGQTFP